MRSKIFSKLSREITVAAKAGLPDPSANAGCASPSRMPAPRTCEGQHRAGHQEGARGRCRELRLRALRGYGPGGVAVIVEALTTPQPHRLECPRAVYQVRRQPRRNPARSPSCSAGWARSSIPLPRPRPMPCWRRRSRRCRRCQLRRVRPHHHLCLRVDRRGVLRPGREVRDAESVKVVWKPQTLARGRIRKRPKA